MGGITHKMALGGNPHFLVLINGMSAVRVGVRTEHSAYICTVCGPFCCIPLLMGGFRQGEEGREEALVTTASMARTASSRQERARPGAWSA